MPRHPIIQPVRMALSLLFSAAALTAQAGGDAVRGGQRYQTKCAACHSPDYNGVGPMHRGVFGRLAGTAKGYVYSPALAKSGITWDEKTLDRWLSNPEKVAPGQRMGFSVEDAQERADLIAHLKTLSAPKSP